MIKNKLPVASEKVLHSQVCDWLNLQYPDIIFTSDSSGSRVSIGLRNEFKRKRCRKYKIPDLIILQPSKNYHGLVIEIKKEGERLTKRNGDYASDHLKEQAISLLRFKEIGYAACFCTGFDECIEVIKDYLGQTHG